MIAFGLLCAGGPHWFATTEDTEVSPNGQYRIDFMKPGFPYLFSLTKQTPMFVRLYDQRSRKLLGESPIVDMNGNGAIFWPEPDAPRIRIGMDIEFPIGSQPDTE